MAEKKFAVDLNLMNNELKNARIESMASDPTVFYAGLFWFNTTQNTLKYSDGTNVYNLAVGGNLADAITQANSYTDTAVSTAQTTLQGNIDSLAQNVSDGDSDTLASANGYTDSSLATINTDLGNLSAALTQEVSNRQGAESTINLAISDSQTAAVTAANAYTDGQMTIEAAARTQGDADTAAAAQLAAETASNAYTDGQITAEASARVQGDTDTLAAANAYTDSQLASLSGDFIGDFNASLGTLPVATGTKAGSNWRVSIGGTIAGLTPVATLETGDLIVSRIANAAVAADFFVLQGNISDAITSAGPNANPNFVMFSSGETDKQTTIVNITHDDIINMAKTFYKSKPIVAGTPVTYTITNKPSDLTSGVPYMSTVSVVDESDGSEVFVGVRRTNNTIIITSNVSFNASIIIETPLCVASIEEILP